MLKLCGIGVAIGNAIQEVKEAKIRNVYEQTKNCAVRRLDAMG